MNEPFFVVGCPRSGTTMLRDVLRLHPNLDAPEETHFYRWCHPYRSPAYRRTYTKNPDILKHRELDGITDDEFFGLFEQSMSRKELQDAYMALFLAKQDNGATRWFDKTPQNFYGISLLMQDYPDSQFVHIFRDPRNVVASMKTGVIIKQDDIVASISYWIEGVSSLLMMQKAWPGRVLAVSYETLLEDPLAQLTRICEFIGETFDGAWIEEFHFEPQAKKYEEVLEDSETAMVMARCESLYEEMKGLAA